MLLLISLVFIYAKNFKYSNTSYVIINRKYPFKTATGRRIQIHLMLLLIFCVLENIRDIYNSNTSYVIINQTINAEIQKILTEFKYILCYY